MNEYMEPSIGRIVHYIAYGTPGGEFKSAHRAAIITEVHTPTCVNLCVLNPTGMFFNTSVQFADVGDMIDDTPGSWHWPEMV
jgi:hypothetical protein